MVDDQLGRALPALDGIAAEIEAWFERQTPPVPVVDQGREADLFESGLMDSFLLVLLVEHLEQEYRVDVPEMSIGVEPLATINRIAWLVVQLSTEEGSRT